MLFETFWKYVSYLNNHKQNAQWLYKCVFIMCIQSQRRIHKTTANNTQTTLPMMV